MGVLTEQFRKKYSSCRTGHPVYSFGVFGKNKKYFENIDNFSAYGEESPFGILKRLDGKIAILDLEDQNSMTFYHHIEEINDVHWRYAKNFKGLYVDKMEKKQIKSIQFLFENSNPMFKPTLILRELLCGNRACTKVANHLRELVCVLLNQGLCVILLQRLLKKIMQKVCCIQVRKVK